MRKTACSKCKKEKGVERRAQAYCKDCQKQYSDQHRIAHPRSAHYKNLKIKLKESGLCVQSCSKPASANNYLCHECKEKQIWNKIKNKFNITKEEYLDKLSSQGNVCALCKEPGFLPGNGKKGGDGYAVDHDHRTDKIRGIIHGRCNSGIGYFRDDPRLMRLAVVYLDG